MSRRDIVDSKDTMYTITFPEDAEDSLKRLAMVLEGLLPEEYIDVEREDLYCHIRITIYEDFEEWR
mgnify:CR=1 FL=1